MTYTAGNGTTEENGVRISGAVRNTALEKNVELTVSGREVFLTLGTGNTILIESETLYRDPWVVRVTDIDGSAVPDVDVELSIVPEYFFKGEWIFPQDAEMWIQDPSPPWQCANEDADRDGVLDPGEDADGDGELEPRNVASPIPGTVTTDDSGSAEFEIEYPKSMARWVTVNLTASAAVEGSESSTTSTFVLPIATSDKTDEENAPPGDPSPFGQVSDCTDPN